MNSLTNACSGSGDERSIMLRITENIGLTELLIVTAAATWVFWPQIQWLSRVLGSRPRRPSG
jgi:hypothetical protein